METRFRARSAECDDAAAVAELSSACFGPDYLPEDRLDELLSAPRGMLTLAETGRRIVGLCLGRMITTSEAVDLLDVGVPDEFVGLGEVALVEAVGVEPDFRHHGVATDLVEASMWEAARRGAEAVVAVLWSPVGDGPLRRCGLDPARTYAGHEAEVGPCPGGDMTLYFAEL